METPAVAETLARLPHFAMLDRGVLERIAAASRARTLGRGEPLFREGEPARAFFAVRAGEVRIFRVAPDGKEQLLQRVRAGQSLAEAAVLTMPRYPASAEAAVAGTEVVEVGAAAFLEIFEQDRRLARAMVASLSVWLARLVRRVEDLTVMSAGARLARHLLDLPAQGSGRRLTVDIALPKKELAATLGITPETLSRLLRKWQDRRVLRVARRRVELLDPDALATLAGEGGEASAGN